MDGLPPTASDSRRSLSLVLPACNEAAGIRHAVVEADEALARLADEYEILVVDDGSTDGTAAAVAQEAARRPAVRLLRHEHNQGYGAALRTGFAAAQFPLVAFTDADCQFDLADLDRLIPLADRHPIVAGYRVHRQDSRRRCLLSGGYNLLTRMLLGTRVRDCDCALKVFRRDALAGILPETNGFFVNAEMLTRARQQGLAVAEVGVRHRPRIHGASKVSLREVPRTLATMLPFWWSRVVFAAPDPVDTPHPRPLSPGTRAVQSMSAVALLLVVAVLLFFSRLRTPLLEPQEPRYAEIPRQMLQQGSFLVPVLHGQPYLDKPPLLYWLVMGSYHLFGVHDWAARLVAGLAGLLTVLTTWWWGRRALGPRAGLVGALVLCLSAEFVYRMRMLTMDGLLALCVTAALACAHAALRGPALRRGWWLAAAAACGLGVLTKGPVAVALVAGPVLAFRLLDPRAARPGLRDGLVFLAAVVAVAGPWFVLVGLREPGFLSYFFWTHNVVRFVAPFDHEKPAWFYLPAMLLGMLPWALLWPGMVRALARRSRRAAARRPAGLGLVLLAGLGCVAFFSASGCKRAGYLLPALPPLALALGWYLDQLLPRAAAVAGWAALWARGSRLAHRATLLVLVVAAGVAVAAGARQMARPATSVLLAAMAVAALVALVRRRRSASWGVCALVTFAVLLGALLELHAGYSRQFALRGRLRTDWRLAHQPGLPVVCYPQRWDSVSFYLPQADVHVYRADEERELADFLRHRPQTLVLVKSGSHLRHFLQALPAAAQFVPRGRPGAVTAGWVCVHEAPTDRLYAGR
jgi:dolichol-phosphate mannosyltransferase